MADKRKLQSDIERTLKRVQEGRTAFQEILDKFEGSVNQTQKEKFEGDLKKEIKKLQRLRDQIKTWLTANEVKDKRPLQDARKEIEQDMERFKVIEKETKTKAYSKEGLLSTDAKKDPLQKEKEELDDWLKQCISSLNTQTEKYEFEIESLTNSNKKKRIDKDTAVAIEEKRQRLDNCCFHVEKLETIMRLLDNERLDCALLRSIKDPIEYVIQCCDEASALDYRNMYDDLKLDEIGDSSGLTAGPGSVPGTTEHDINGVPGSTAGGCTHRSGNDDAGSSASTHTSSSNHTDSSVTHPSSSTSSNASSSRERTRSDEKVTPLNHVSVSSTSTPLKPAPTSSATPGGGSSKQKLSHLANQTAPPALLSQVVAGTPNKANRSFTGHTSNGVSHNSSSGAESVTPKSRTITADSQADSSNRTPKGDGSLKQTDKQGMLASSASYGETQYPQLKTSCISEPPDSGLSSLTQGPAASSLSAPTTSTSASIGGKIGFAAAVAGSGLTALPVTCTSSPSSGGTSAVSQSSSLPATSTLDPYSASMTSSFPASQLAVTMPSGLGMGVSQDRQLAGLLTGQQSSANGLPDGRITPCLTLDGALASSLSNKLHSVAAATGQVLSLTGVISPGSSQGQHPHVPLDKQLSGLQTSLHTQPQRVPPCVQMHPRDAAAPFRNRNLDKSKGPPPPELMLQLHALESGYRRLPHPCDTEKSRMLVCKNVVHTPSYYPREPPPGTDTEDYYMKLDAQTLFFIFYHFEGTKAQYFAAKALKRMSWRFHTKFMMWFQRHEEPKQITDEYESGSYIYYDFKTMSQRKKEEFMFHYSFLEDKDF
ncbi:CCR4-NOT transcription complex, subunit 3 [Clonorchis sinensis]|uniref:CCR4-NOT transcription complex, subunit 3 n=2 Tax=Clonorchis sinensis TaxID=79923 RepID=A0A8T1MQJ2_CLOSI|nr:CCR4-NOT transcription complex, subunit 3 [Clonorchis sinensis]GAA28857.2 CCR4-NOT transcription complex subunit 3 [Clonorchis sinensis]